MSPAWFFLSIVGALSAILPLNITESGPDNKSAPGELNLRLHPFPNPFPIPGTDITIQWAQVPDRNLLKLDIEGAFLECNTRAAAYVRFTGDGPIPGYFEVAYRTVVVIFTQAYQEAADIILYSEVSDILMATSWMISRQGYRQTWVGVIDTHGGGFLGSLSVVEYVEVALQHRRVVRLVRPVKTRIESGKLE